MTDPEGPSIGELSRQVRDVFLRFEQLARRLEEGQFVRTDLYTLRNQGFDQSIKQVSDSLTGKVDKADFLALQKDVSELQDTNKWLMRLVIGFVVLAILGTIIASNGGL